MKKVLYACFWICFSFHLLAQESKQDLSFETYRDTYRQLLSDFSKNEKLIRYNFKHTSPEDHSNRILNELLLFDMDEMYGNTNLIKEYGSHLKSQEVYVNNIQIKSLISLKYLNSLRLSRQNKAFEQEMTRLLKQAKQSRDYYALSKAYDLKAFYNVQTNKRDSAVYYTNVALINARKQNDKLLLIDVIINQAELYHKIKNDELSISKAYLALQLSVEQEYYFGIFKANIVLAMINAQHDSKEEMKQNLSQAYHAADRMNFTPGKQYITLYEIQAKPHPTQQDILTINAIKGKIENEPQLLAMISIIEAGILADKGEYEKAQSSLNASIVEYEKLGDIDGLQTSYQKVADIFLKRKKYEKAIFYLQKSRVLLTEDNNHIESIQLLKKISAINALQGNVEEAYRHLKEYIRVKDSLQIADLQLNVTMMQQQSKMDERERLITLQSDSIQEQKKQQNYTTTMLENVQLKNNLKTYIIIGFAGLMLLGGIIVFFKWNQNLIKQRQNEAEMNQTLLRTQMNPHFVFNAMSVIQSYIYENDTKNSTKFLINFSKLMRLILENSSKEFIPIQIEDEILEKYLSVQKLRFEDRFRFRIFTEQILLDDEMMIPPMVTQPFIENAIEHGQLHLKEDGFIEVHFKKLDNRLIQIQVIDNGIGWNSEVTKQKNKGEYHKSMAIGITKSRIITLNKKYKTNGTLQYENLDKENKTGTIVTVTIPYITNNSSKI